MILDLQTMFSGSVSADGVTKTGQAITATAIGANVIDLQQTDALALVGAGYVVFQVQTAAAGGDAAKTLTLSLESDSTADLATAPIVHWKSGPITGATLLAGYIAGCARMPGEGYKRYVGVRYTVSAGFTAFNMLAYLTMSPQRNRVFPGSFSID